MGIRPDLDPNSFRTVEEYQVACIRDNLRVKYDTISSTHKRPAVTPLGRLLCALGRHRWERYTDWGFNADVCPRCDAVRLRSKD
jgi:hypothetical protein